MVRTRRRLYPIVDPSLQYKFLALVLAYGMAIVVFLGICLFVPDILTMNNTDLSLEVRAVAAQRMLGLHSRVWPAIIALVCLVGIHSVRIFHRLIGPLYRFRWAFLKISKGDLGFQVSLRKKDYLHREEAALNQMMEVFAGKWGVMRIAALDALKSLDAFEQALTEVNGWADKDQQILQKHRRHLEVLVDHARYFRLKEEESPGQGVGEQPA